MKYTLLTILAFQFATISAQDLYDLNVIQEIEITFEQSNWDQLLDDEKAGDENYIMAQSVKINGEVYDSVGVKYKGNSTYSSNQAKNPFHIELDTYKDHDHQGYKDIKLSNVAKDPSFLREVISYQVIRNYMDAPLCNYANVYVNNNLIGLYTNAESISKTFVKDRFKSKSNTFVKCNPPDGAGPGGSDYPSLEYLGEDSVNYYNAYELKSDYGWDELIDLCDTLVNFSDNIEEILDVDRALWMLALNNVMVNLDSYIGGFTQNYYLYRDDNGRFVPVIWDLNESFGRFTMTGSGNLRNNNEKQQMSHLLHENSSAFPLVQKLLSNPLYKRMYLAHYKTILLEQFENDSYATFGESMQDIIDDAVAADNNKFFTYNNFLENLDSDVGGGGPGGGSTIGITNLMNVRTDYLLTQSDFTALEPTISKVEALPDTTANNERVLFTATVIDADAVFLVYRNGEYGAFSRLTMLDDGIHDDGIPGNKIYGLNIPVDYGTTHFYIYAENDDIGKFSPERAAKEYYFLMNQSSISGIDDLVINEFMASNDTTAIDQDGDFDDWIELYNNGTESIDLEGISLSDDIDDLAQWSFPSGAIIGPNEYLIVWADEDDDQAGFHADFKLSASGESIYLSDTVGDMIDEVTYSEQTTDISFGRFPNGTGDFQIMMPTFNAENSISNECDNLGGDADNDGICADEDCDDNDAGVGGPQLEGTSCDDGDATTENDVIQADGCSCAGTLIVTTSDVVINEFMTSNDSTVVDQDGDADDWIELYNKGAQSIDLSNFFLSDDEGNLSKWQFPAGTSIESDGYLIVWADEDEDQTGLHADFKLSRTGESILLSDPDTTIVDAITYTEQETDISFGRFPNGTGGFQFMTPTFNAENSIISNLSDIAIQSIDLQVFPNPGVNKITVNSKIILRSINIYDMMGKRIITKNSSDKIVDVDVISLVSGTYLLQVITDNNKSAVTVLHIEK